MPANQRTGKAFVLINGVQQETMDGATLSDPGGISRAVSKGNAVFGYTEQIEVPTLECEFAHGTGVSTQALVALTNETIIFRCDSGVDFVLTNAWYANGMKVKVQSGQGTVPAVFQCKKCNELITTS